MRKVFIIMAVAAMTSCASQAPSGGDSLTFDPSSATKGTLEMPTGGTVTFTAYEKIYFVANVVDSTYQYMNIYVPEGATDKTPIFLRTYVGGYMASEAAAPQAGDASGRALAEGYVVVIPGSRGRNSKVGNTYTGRAPAAILDLKAAIRYLRHFDNEIPGDSERIITDGTSAGGAMSALMGATGNNPNYDLYLKEMGAADERDDVFASVCFCPIIDLDHADMAYEWLFGGTESRQGLDETHSEYSKELAGLYPAYLESLKLKKEDGTPLNANNFLDFIKSEIIHSAQIAKDAGADISENLGFKFSSSSRGRFAAPINGGVSPGGTQAARGGEPRKGDAPGAPQGFGGPGAAGNHPARGAFNGSQAGEYIIDLDMEKYLNYVVSTQALKGVPAFDSLIEGVNSASGENDEFGDTAGSSVNFTEFTAAKNGAEVTKGVNFLVALMNPMNFIGDPQTTVAPHWYIRHGARDRDTAFPVPVAFATRLKNEGFDVDFLLAWNRPHSGDYALDELFSWIREITK